jgi:cell division protein FtsL
VIFTEEKYFLELLSVASMILLIFSVTLTITDYNQNEQNATAISHILQKINSTIESQGAENLTPFEQLQYNESVLTQLISWNGQGTISWGVTFLATITVFFMILLELHPKENQKEKPKENAVATILTKGDKVLYVLALIFLALSLLSVYMILYYYRYVASLQNTLTTIPGTHYSLLYIGIVTYPLFELIFLAISIIVVWYLNSELRQLMSEIKRALSENIKNKRIFPQSELSDLILRKEPRSVTMKQKR